MEKSAYGGWKNCYRLANRRIELIVTGDVGPRVIRFGFVGGENEFKEYPAMLGKTGGRKWRIYGGHRLWHAPEVEPRTYEPDNGPVEVREHRTFVRVVQPPEACTGIQKELDLRVHASAARVDLVHRLRNCGPWGVELAAWGVTVMAPGGTAVVPLPPRIPFPGQLLPGSSLTIWPYVDMGDPRFTWGSRYILMRQDPALKNPQKIGAWVPDGWAAYARGRTLFVKRFASRAGAPYPDFGCCFETFTNKDMLEMESLGPLTRLEPGQSVEHTETWELLSLPGEVNCEADVERLVEPIIRRRN